MLSWDSPILKLSLQLEWTIKFKSRIFSYKLPNSSLVQVHWLLSLLRTMRTMISELQCLPGYLTDLDRRTNSLFPALGISLNADSTTTPRLSFSSIDDLLIIEGVNYHVSDAVVICDIMILARTQSQARHSMQLEKIQITLQWYLDWISDCHKTAFGNDFSPTREIAHSQSYRRFCQGLIVKTIQTKKGPSSRL
jgi:hypothetical protein